MIISFVLGEELIILFIFLVELEDILLNSKKMGIVKELYIKKYKMLILLLSIISNLNIHPIWLIEE